jgi:hypothetical protein
MYKILHLFLLVEFVNNFTMRGMNIINFNPLNAELYSICNLLALFGAQHILHVGRIRVNESLNNPTYCKTSEMSLNL